MRNKITLYIGIYSPPLLHYRHYRHSKTNSLLQKVGSMVSAIVRFGPPMMLALKQYYDKTKQSHAKHLITWIHVL